MKNKSIQKYEAYRAGEITREQFGAAKKQLEEEKDILRKRIQEVEELIHNEKEFLPHIPQASHVLIYHIP